MHPELTRQLTDRRSGLVGRHQLGSVGGGEATLTLTLPGRLPDSGIDLRVRMLSPSFIRASNGGLGARLT